jgi:hypothetical protein
MPRSQRPKASPSSGSSYSDPSLVLALRASLKSVQNDSCRFSRSRARCIARLFATGMWQRPKAERASRTRAPDSPAPGKSRMLEQPGQTKNTEEFDDGFEVECGLIVVDCGHFALPDGSLLCVVVLFE